MPPNFVPQNQNSPTPPTPPQQPAQPQSQPRPAQPMRHVPGTPYGVSDSNRPSYASSLEAHKKSSTGFFGGLIAAMLFLVQLFDLWGLQFLGWIDEFILSKLPPMPVSFFFPDFYTNAPWVGIGFPSSITEFLIPLCYYWLLGVTLGGLVSNLASLLTWKLHRVNRVWVILFLVWLSFSSFIFYYQQYWGIGDGRIEVQECADISDEAARTECLLRVVDGNGDISLCAQIGSLESQTTCYRLAAIVKKDDSICDFIKEEALFADCLEQVNGQEVGDAEVN